MTKFEKVIQGLECCKKLEWDCSHCPYGYYGNSYNECSRKLMNDALELLKTTEPKKRESKAMLPCKCGCKRREHWIRCSSNEKETEGLKCIKCGFEVWGKNSTDVIRKWNEAVKQNEADRSGDTEENYT